VVHGLRYLTARRQSHQAQRLSSSGSQCRRVEGGGLHVRGSASSSSSQDRAVHVSNEPLQCRARNINTASHHAQQRRVSSRHSVPAGAVRSAQDYADVRAECQGCGCYGDAMLPWQRCRCSLLRYGGYRVVVTCMVVVTARAWLPWQHRCFRCRAECEGCGLSASGNDSSRDSAGNSCDCEHVNLQLIATESTDCNVPDNS